MQSLATKEELQEAWSRLGLKSSTLLHLQEVLDTAGLQTALAVTEVLVRQKGEPHRFEGVGKEWGEEVLRLLSLEGLKPYIVDMLRVGVEALLTWHILVIAEIDSVVDLTFTAFFLLACFLFYLVLRRRRKKAKKRKK